MEVERPWELARDPGQQSWPIPIRSAAYPRGRFFDKADIRSFFISCRSLQMQIVSGNDIARIIYSENKTII